MSEETGPVIAILQETRSVPLATPVDALENPLYSLTGEVQALVAAINRLVAVLEQPRRGPMRAPEEPGTSRSA